MLGWKADELSAEYAAKRRQERMATMVRCPTCNGVGRLLKDVATGRVMRFSDRTAEVATGLVEVVCTECHGLKQVPCDCGGG